MIHDLGDKLMMGAVASRDQIRIAKRRHDSRGQPLLSDTDVNGAVDTVIRFQFHDSTLEGIDQENFKENVPAEIQRNFINILRGGFPDLPVEIDSFIYLFHE